MNKHIITAQSVFSLCLCSGKQPVIPLSRYCLVSPVGAHTLSVEQFSSEKSGSIQLYPESV